MPAPIMTPCEGGGCTGHMPYTLRRLDGTLEPRAMCACCGQFHMTPLGEGTELVPHDRTDVLAMIHRGDFDQPTREVEAQALTRLHEWSTELNTARQAQHDG